MNFDAYWQQIDDELDRLPARAVVDPVPAWSTEESTCYDVRLTSSGPYRIFGHLSVPTGPGPFPALLQTPRHGSVNLVAHPDDRSRYLVFTVAHRGQRRADDDFVAPYPGLLTLGIEDPATYIYRGIVADCVRGAEFLLSREEVDPSRIAVSGDDLALITAARRPGFSVLRVQDLLLYRALEARQSTSDYPLEELNDYLRTEPDATERVRRTLAYFDVVRHAPAVTARTLVATADPDWCAPLVAALPAAEVYRLTLQDAADMDGLDAWLAGRLGTTPMSRFSRTPG